MSLRAKIGHATIEFTAAEDDLNCAIINFKTSVMRAAPTSVQEAARAAAHERLTILLDSVGRQQTYIRHAILRNGDIDE